MSILDDLEKEFGDIMNASEKEVVEYVIEVGKESLDTYKKKKDKRLLNNGKGDDLKKAAKCAYIAGSKSVLEYCVKEMKGVLKSNESLPYRIFLENIEKDKNFKERIKKLTAPNLSV